MRGRKPNLVQIVRNDVSGQCPPPPAWLTKHAKAEWRRAAPELQARGLLTEDVMATVEAYCVAAGMIRETEEIMAAEGRLIQGKDGAAPHPAFRMQNTAMREARLLAAELGLTPHRRGGQPTKKEDPNDKWEGDLLA